jgi:hypothetical protein
MMEPMMMEPMMMEPTMTEPTMTEPTMTEPMMTEPMMLVWLQQMTVVLLSIALYRRMTIHKAFATNICWTTFVYDEICTFQGTI